MKYYDNLFSLKGIKTRKSLCWPTSEAGVSVCMLGVGRLRHGILKRILSVDKMIEKSLGSSIKSQTAINFSRLTCGERLELLHFLLHPGSCGSWRLCK